MTIVKKVSFPKKFVKTLLSAIPVTIPGSAIGNTKRSEIESLPKKSYRAIAAAASEPKTNAIAVAKRATIAERVIASRIPTFSTALVHHSVVKPVGGQAKDLFLLKELITTRTSGRYIKVKPEIITARSVILAVRESLISY